MFVRTLPFLDDEFRFFGPVLEATDRFRSRSADVVALGEVQNKLTTVLTILGPVVQRGRQSRAVLVDPLVVRRDDLFQDPAAGPADSMIRTNLRERFIGLVARFALV